jgi:hypothetical protein
MNASAEETLYKSLKNTGYWKIQRQNNVSISVRRFRIELMNSDGAISVMTRQACSDAGVHSFEHKYYSLYLYLIKCLSFYLSRCLPTSLHHYVGFYHLISGVTHIGIVEVPYKVCERIELHRLLHQTAPAGQTHCPPFPLMPYCEHDVPVSCSSCNR